REFTIAGDSVVLLGGTVQLSGELPAASGRGPSRIHWESSDTAVAPVDTLGVVTGRAIGTAEITARLVAPDVVGDVVRKLAVEVVYAAIAIDPVDSLTGIGETRSLAVHGLAVDQAPDAQLPATFSSPDSGVVAVTPVGTVTALSNGLATVTATYEGYTTNTTVKVRQVAKQVSFSVPRIDLPGLNHDTTVAVEVRDTHDSIIAAPLITWSSSDSTAVTVTSSGVIRAVSFNPAHVIAQSDTVAAQIPVAVVRGVASLLVHDGDNQSATVGTAVPIAPAVVALDDGGNPVPAVWVTFTVSDGGGQLIGPVQLTNASGVARLGSWTLGTTAGGNSVTATAEDQSTAITAMALPGPVSALASQLSVSRDTVGIGDTAVLTLHARDEYGNLLTGGGLNVVFSHAGGTSTGLISGTVDNSDGTYTAAFTGSTAGTATNINATMDGLPVTSPRPTITVAAWPAELLIVAGNSQTANAGSAVATQPAVLVSDGGGNPVGGVPVTFTVSLGGGTITDSVQVTGADGLATLGSWTLGTTAGPNALTASVAGLSAEFDATGVPGPADLDRSTITLSDDTVAAGSGAVLGLVVRDAFGNRHAAGGLNVSFYLSGGTSDGTIGPVADNGDGSYSADFTGETAGTASDVGATIAGDQVTSARPAVTVIPGPPASVTPQAGDNQTTLVGTRVPIPPAVLVQDSFNNPIPGTAVSFAVSAGGGSVVGSPAVTDSAGVAGVAGWTMGPSQGYNSLNAVAGGPQHVFTATATVPVVLDTVVLGSLLLGAEPYRIAVSEARDLAYVTNRSSDYVTVIDVVGDSAAGTITVGGKPAGIAMHRTNGRVYVASEVTNVLTVVDGLSHSIITAIDLGETPAGVAIDEVQSRVYVALPGSNRVAVINSTNSTVAGTVGVGSNPQWLAVDRGNSLLFVSNTGEGTVTVIDTQGPSVNATLNVGINPQGIAVDEGAQKAFVATRGGVAVLDRGDLEKTLSLPDADYQGIAVGARILVANATANELLILNSSSGSQVGSVAVGQGARGVAVHSGSNRVYVAGSSDNSVTVVRDNQLEAVITSVGGPRGVAAHSSADLVFVANGVSNNVSVIDGATHSIVGAPIPVGSSPWGVAVSEATDRLYVTNSGDGTVSVIDVMAKAGISTVGVGGGPRGVAVNPVSNRIYVANYADNTVSVIEGANNAVLATVPVGASPTAIVVDTVANRIYVAHEVDDVRVIDGVTNGVVGSIGPLGGAPSAIAWNGETHMLFVPNNTSPGAIWLLDAATSSVIGSTAVAGVPASVCTDALRDLLMVPTSSAIQYLNGTTGATVYTMFVATDALGVALNQQTDKVFIADETTNVNGIIILQN
ncbi:MAG: beta-propeller fold lactonase family protein, partial [Gemmatimonadota bacterium]